MGKPLGVRVSLWAPLVSRMTIPTHALAGLIIGKITGNYPAAIAGSLVIDLDHTVSYFRHRILFNPRELVKATLTRNDPWTDQRHFLHSIFSWVVISGSLVVLIPHIGVPFAAAYFFHLVLDAIEKSGLYPFFPYKTIALKGFITYASIQELLFAMLLIGIFSLLSVV